MRPANGEKRLHHGRLFKYCVVQDEDLRTLGSNVMQPALCCSRAAVRIKYQHHCVEQCWFEMADHAPSARMPGRWRDASAQVCGVRRSLDDGLEG